MVRLVTLVVMVVLVMVGETVVVLAVMVLLESVVPVVLELAMMVLQTIQRPRHSQGSEERGTHHQRDVYQDTVCLYAQAEPHVYQNPKVSTHMEWCALLYDYDNATGCPF